ncbi:MAG: nucleotide sugar dehydrogenase [Phycisphaerales bacterium]|nr:nucleotide sugar dehydrogenase [Phycisphaerales bacterium]
MSTADSSKASTTSSPAGILRQRLADRSATIGVVGMGYVGMPLAHAMLEAGFPVLGFDVDDRKISKLDTGEIYLPHLGEAMHTDLAASKRFAATSDSARLEAADVIILCVPTPLGPHREPDLAFVLESTRMAAGILRPGQLVVLESTTYPGTTRNEMQPILEKTGLACGQDFFLAYSPEREDPGRKGVTTKAIPKLVGGVDDTSTDLAMLLYGAAVEDAHRVSSAEIAESAKILENVYRAVNIALVNELKLILEKMDIDIWEVVEAAATKPFGFQAFYPGPGLGGHCIPIDPFYLAWKARELGHTTRFIELAGEINSQMPAHVVAKVAEALNTIGRPIRGSKVLVLGIAYKPDVEDVRESPAATIIELLLQQGAEVAYHDPHCPHFPEMRQHDIDLNSVSLDEATLAASDCVLIVTDHSNVDYPLVGRSAALIVDTRNAMADVADPVATIIKA